MSAREPKSYNAVADARDERNTEVETPAIDNVPGAIDAVVEKAMRADTKKSDEVSAPVQAEAAAEKDDPFASFSEAGAAARPKEEAPRVSKAIPIQLTRESAIELLGKVNLFTGLPRVYLERIASLCVEEVHPAGEFVFRENMPGDKLYLILEGAVRISRNVPGMGEEALAVLKSGDYFGEMALIDDFPRSADAYVHESCRLLVIGKEKLQDLLFVDRDLAYDLLWTFVRTLSGRLRQTNDKMTFMAVTSKF